jgi:hypothetical protein
MLQQKSNLRAKLVFLLLSVVLAACTDLTAVHNWSSTSLEATQFTEIVATYADTPERLVVYDQGAADFWKAQAKVRDAQATALELQLSLVADYMASLAALSADSVADYTSDIGTLTASLKKTGQVSDATLGAAGKLATTIANAAVKLWQKEKVGLLIEQANPSLQNLLNGELKSIVDEDFRRDLKVEAQFLDRHFEDLLRAPGASAAAKAALNEWFVLRKAENMRHMTAVDAYVSVLSKISEGHQKLFDGRDELDGVQLVKDLYKLAKEIRNNIKKIIMA